jgi:hypothetical protein
MRTICRRFTFGLLALLCSSLVLSQSSAKPANQDSLYALALFSSLEKMQTEWGMIDDTFENRIKTNYHEMPVLKDPRITDDLPLQHGEYRVEFMDYSALKERFERLHKEFRVMEISPIKNKGSVLIIQISVSVFSYHKGKYMFAFSDWSDVEFRFDNIQQKFIVSNIHLGGI